MGMAIIRFSISKWQINLASKHSQSVWGLQCSLSLGNLPTKSTKSTKRSYPNHGGLSF